MNKDEHKAAASHAWCLLAPSITGSLLVVCCFGWVWDSLCASILVSVINTYKTLVSGYVMPRQGYTHLMNTAPKTMPRAVSRGL